MDHGWPSLEAREWAQLVVDDLRRQANAQRVAEGGLDITPTSIGAAPKVIDAEFEVLKDDAPPLVQNPPDAPRKRHYTSLAEAIEELDRRATRRDVLGRVVDVEDDLYEMPKRSPQSVIPKFIKLPRSVKKLRKLEDKWAGTLSNL